MNVLRDVQGSRLTPAQQEELEMARRRAEKAAKGKAANTAAVARRVKRRNSFSSDRSDDDLQLKLSTVTDEKEAKRLKRWVSLQQATHSAQCLMSKILVPMTQLNLLLVCIS
jgi:hypothetical protein